MNENYGIYFYLIMLNLSPEVMFILYVFKNDYGFSRTILLLLLLLFGFLYNVYRNIVNFWVIFSFIILQMSYSVEVEQCTQKFTTIIFTSKCTHPRQSKFIQSFFHSDSEIISWSLLNHLIYDFIYDCWKN